ncbi:MAG: GNAT family N-acetyltransferase [Flavobacteriales bacterium]|nr:GNAT family N-acetyltransferase [Flavobacteriales bacterium]
MQTTIRPMHTADLPAVAALHPTAAAPLLAHVRWCLHTPYATALVLVHANAILGVATVVRFGTSAQVGRFHIHPAHQRQGLGTLLWHAVVAQHTAQHMPILLHCDPRILAFWERQGLVEQCAFPPTPTASSKKPPAMKWPLCNPTIPWPCCGWTNALQARTAACS